MRLSPSAIDPQGRARWIRECQFAHRGLHGEGMIENSPAAFAAAIERGLGIECDVQLTGDGEAMVFHDFALDRLTGESGAVIARTAADLAAIRLTGSENTIPTLAQLLAQIGGRVPVLIEVKSARRWPIVRLCAGVDRALAGYQGALAVMSFDPRVPQWFARHAPAIVRGLVVSEEGDGDRRLGHWRGIITRRVALWQARADFLACDIRSLPSAFAARQRRKGLPIASWTIRSPELLARARLHADAPICEGAGMP